MHRRAAIGEQEIAEHRVRRAEGDCLDAAAAVGPQIGAHVVRADQPRVLQPVPRQHEDRRDMPRPEWPRLLQRLEQR